MGPEHFCTCFDVEPSDIINTVHVRCGRYYDREHGSRPFHTRFDPVKHRDLRLQHRIPKAGPKPDRNAPCLCGSGRKQKKCCGA